MAFVRHALDLRAAVAVTHVLRVQQGTTILGLLTIARHALDLCAAVAVKVTVQHVLHVQQGTTILGQLTIARWHMYT
jgi:hypothetical protein